MNLTHLVIVGLGGALGAIGRYLTVAMVTNMMGSRFPWGTLTVNIIGSFVLGLAYVFIAEKLHAETHLRPLIMVGFLGAFTTFSTFSLETFSLLEKGNLLAAGGYVLLSVILCVLVTGIAVTVVRALI